ncbi:T9SS type A sorting domain-containing protein [Polluticoccus soli]|uniref:T9SS type A sorting domain-containing protein n=1 Tax=Polluticoccus soli TaxID=3034150 RepID=UPI0023E2722E|nr:T9SS type A sorting domain-containing protein [Flavipsychrobacter sp. JY13-12]
MKYFFYTLKTLCVTAVLLSLALISLAQTPQYFITGGTSANSFPFNSTTSNKVQWIYVAGSFAGSPTGVITKVYFRSGTTGTNKTFTNLTIKMGYTTQINTTTTFIPGLTTVFFAPSIVVPTVTNGQWVELTLTTPFFYNNTQNLVVEASQTAFTPSGFTVLQNSAGGNKRTWGAVTATTGSAGTGLADFGYQLLAYQNNASISAIPEPGVDICVGAYAVKAQVKNMGSNTINNVQLNWSVNGAIQPPVMYNSPIPITTTSAPIMLGNVSLMNPVANNTIRVWTSLPNGVVDPMPTDDSMEIIRKPLDLPNAVIYYPTTRLCPGDSVLLQAGTGTNYFYQWQFNADPTGPITSQGAIYAKKDGYYSVKVFNPGCSQQAAPVKITVKPLAIDLGPDLITCEKQPALALDAGEPGSRYKWNTGDTTQVIHTKEGNNIYWVEATLGTMCKASDTVNLTIDPLPRVNGISFINKGTSTYTFSPAGNTYVNSYLWDFGDGSTDTAQIATHTYSIAPPYNVTLKVFNSCGMIESKLPVAVGINDVNGVEGLTLYPNPAQNSLNVGTNGSALIKDIRVYNTLGALVVSRSYNNEKNVVLDVAHLPNGMYSIRITTSMGTAAKQFQVTK